jgi:gluconate:H+ symporter, GntP family
MLGAILEVSGGAEALSARLLGLFGEKRAPLAMGLTGLIFGIPVFFDVGIFVLAPIVYAAAKRSGKSIVLYAMPMLAGLSMTHAFLPPHPGPVAAAGLLHVDLGWVILMGVLVGVPSVLAAWAYAAWIGNRLFVPVPQDMLEAAEEAKEAVAAEQRAAVIEFFGHPFVALTIALLLAYYLLGIRRGWSRTSLETVSTASLKPIGNILLAVGAGGVFGAVLPPRTSTTAGSGGWRSTSASPSGTRSSRGPCWSRCCRWRGSWSRGC